MNLVFVYESSDGCTYSCTNTIPFEYSSVDDFQFMVLEKIKEHKEACVLKYGAEDGEKWYRNGTIKIFDNHDIEIGHIEDCIERVYTLEEWFTKNKETL